MKLTDLTIADAKKLLLNKEISAVELTEAYIKNMEKYSYLNAYVTSNPEIALEQAKIADDNIAKEYL